MQTVFCGDKKNLARDPDAGAGWMRRLRMMWAELNKLQLD
jgi:hypothetical protein